MSAVPEPAPGASPADWEPPPGMRRAMEAYWRDLPALLKSRHRGKWVAYHGDERIGFARTQVELYRECDRRGLDHSEYWIDLVAPAEQAPWEIQDDEQPEV
jgi:uncharacterized protein DUF5678